MSKKKQKAIDSDKTNNEEESKPGFFKKIKSSLGKAVNKIDSKTNPKTGKIIYVTSRWLTIASFVIVIPMFVLFYQFAMIENGTTFNYTGVDAYTTSEGTVIYDSKTFTASYTYEEINNSIDIVYETGSFENTIFYDTVQEANPSNSTLTDEPIYFFYGVSNGGYNFGETITDEEEYFNDSTTTPATTGAREIFAMDLANLTLTPDDEQADYLTDVAYVKDTFYKFFGVESFTTDNDTFATAGLITSWTLVVVGMLFLFSTLWFSKFSEVPLKEPTEDTKDDKKSKKGKGKKLNG